MKKLKYFGLTFAVWLMVGADAMAQNRDWANPINEKINLLVTGLQYVAVALASVGLIIAAFSYVTQQRIDVPKVAAVLVGAMIATLASTVVPAFFG